MKIKKILLILFAASQLAYGIYASVQIAKGALAMDIYHAILLLLLVSNLSIIYGVYQNRQRKQLERDLQEAQYLMQMEQMNYQAIEEKRIQVAKICHDLNNQLATVQQLLLEQQQDYAADLLEEMKASIQKGLGNHICDHKLINIVLNDKQRLFAQEQIELELAVQLNEASFVQEQQLCSLFSNVLQLALTVCKGQTVPQQCHVRVQAKEADGQFLLRCGVTGINLQKERLQGKAQSYEDKLLRDIAAQYQGHYTVEGDETGLQIELCLLQRREE